MPQIPDFPQYPVKLRCLAQKILPGQMKMGARWGPGVQNLGPRLRWKECLEGQWYAWNGTKNLDNAETAEAPPNLALVSYWELRKTLDGQPGPARLACINGQDKMPGRDDDVQLQAFFTPTILQSLPEMLLHRITWKIDGEHLLLNRSVPTMYRSRVTKEI